ncbi:galactose oxidase [Backusella circina FSU 941]|nr:galactose oxidase [Backusella circina FSU 941]
MYSLNLSLSWNTSEPAWEQQLASDPNDVTYPVSFFAATYLPASHYFVVNGGTCDASLQSFKKQTYYYDALNDKWELPTVKGVHLAQRKQHAAVSDDQGRVWVWGGTSDMSTYGGNTIYYNAWMIINTLNWTISYPPVSSNPSPRIDHTATMISNKYILIIGGVVYSHDVTDPNNQLTLNPVSMSSLLLFDMSNNRWLNITAGGNIPAPRRGHSAVLGLDGKSVIVFGGGTPDDDHTQLNDVFILELATMRWIAPSIKGVPPQPRKYHKAYLVDDYMLVVFGLGGDARGLDDVSILSTSSWSWITQYTANSDWLSGNTSSAAGAVKNSTGNGITSSSYDPDTYKSREENNDTVSTDTRIKAGVIAGVVSGAVVVLGGSIFLVLSMVIFRKRHKSSLAKKPTHSNSIDPATGASTISDLVLEPERQFIKPDNRSSLCYATQIDDGTFYKPNDPGEDK